MLINIKVIFFIVSDGAQLVRSRFHAGKKERKTADGLYFFSHPADAALNAFLPFFSTVKETVTDDKEKNPKLCLFKRELTYMLRRL